jgi:DNA uptake protein ComE-like DNA-binding protein
MWKDWLFFSKSQRKGIIVLLSIILLLTGFRFLVPFFHSPPQQGNDSFVREASNFEASLRNDSSRMPGYRTQCYTHRDFAGNEPAGNTAAKVTLFRFNPNTLDSAGFVRLGLKPKIASNIIRYRLRGGKFKTAEDISKIWGITPEKAKELEAMADIPAEITVNKPITKTSATKQADIEVEINSADTALLKRIPGIGSGFAARITGYRKRLGGYVAVSQLREVYGIDEQMYSHIAGHFTVNSALVNKIDVNRASIERLKSHPYLNFYKAKAIYELRRTKGRLNDAGELSSLEEIDAQTLTKIKPYLDFGR